MVDENMAGKKGFTYFENLEEFVGQELGLGFDMSLNVEKSFEEKADGIMSYGMARSYSLGQIEVVGERNVVTKHSIRGSMTQKAKGKWKKRARDKGNIAELIKCFPSKKRGLIDEEEGLECEEGRKKMRGNELRENITLADYCRGLGKL